MPFVRVPAGSIDRDIRHSGFHQTPCTQAGLPEFIFAVTETHGLGFSGQIENLRRFPEQDCFGFLSRFFIFRQLGMSLHFPSESIQIIEQSETAFHIFAADSAGRSITVHQKFCRSGIAARGKRGVTVAEKSAFGEAEVVGGGAS